MSEQLELFAKEINHRLDQADRLVGQADDHRIAAAIQIAKAREAADAAGVAWEKWCADNIQRSQRDIYRLLKIGQSDDPVAALKDEREGNRESQRKARRPISHDMSVRPRKQEPIQQALSLLPRLKPEEAKAVAEMAGYQVRKALPGPVVSPRDSLVRAIEAVDDDTLADVLIRTFWHRIGDVLARKIGETESPAKASDIAASAVNRPAAGASRASGGAGTPAPDAARPSNRDVSAGDEPSLTAGSGEQAVQRSKEQEPDGRSPGHEGRDESGAGDADGAAPVVGAGNPAPENSERREGDATPSATLTDASPSVGETAADYFAIPPVLDRANWHNGHPPGRA